MKYLVTGIAFLLVILGATSPALSQAHNTPASGQKEMLLSQDANLAFNKKLVYDFWREVLEAGRMDLASQFMTETYIQHNPNVPTGRQGFIEFFSKFRKPQPFCG